MDDGSCGDDRINRSYHGDHLQPKIIVAATHYMTQKANYRMITCSLLQCLARYWQVLSESFLQLRKLSRSMLLQCCANVANAESPTACRIRIRITKKSDDPLEQMKKCWNLTSLESHDLMARKIPGNRSSWGSLGSRHIFELDFLQLFPPRQPGKYWNILWKQKKYFYHCYMLYVYSWLLQFKAFKSKGM